MRWKPQVDDEANKGLHILKDLMLPVAKVSGVASRLAREQGGEPVRCGTVGLCSAAQRAQASPPVHLYVQAYRCVHVHIHIQISTGVYVCTPMPEQTETRFNAL